MTKNELLNTINHAYKESIEGLADRDYLKERLLAYTDEEGKLSSERATVFCVLECMRMTKEFITNLLENIYETDD